MNIKSGAKEKNSNEFLDEGNKKNGFIQARLVMVLIISSILLSFLVPTMVYCVNRIEKEQRIIHADKALTEVQKELDRMYKKKEFSSGLSAYANDILGKAEVASDCESFIIGMKRTINMAATADRMNYKIVYASYMENGKTLYYTGDTWVEDASKVSLDDVIMHTIK
ncbi:MAG: type II secretion system protein [Lachnospiraceae bacterium]|nr:type II secretion system protein [Lachnospiraceae bacterium]